MLKIFYQWNFLPSGTPLRSRIFPSESWSYIGHRYRAIPLPNCCILPGIFPWNGRTGWRSWASWGSEGWRIEVGRYRASAAEQENGQFDHSSDLLRAWLSNRLLFLFLHGWWKYPKVPDWGVHRRRRLRLSRVYGNDERLSVKKKCFWVPRETNIFVIDLNSLLKVFGVPFNIFFL